MTESETRSAAKRLCQELDELGITPLPRPDMVIVARQAGQDQQVRLLRTDAGRWCWWWCWPPYRTSDQAWDIEPAVPMGAEADLARRLANVLTLSAVEQRVTS